MSRCIFTTINRQTVYGSLMAALYEDDSTKVTAAECIFDCCILIALSQMFMTVRLERGNQPACVETTMQ